jgi:putative radical SAM enzyme (TIGR03279 family)
MSMVNTATNVIAEVKSGSPADRAGVLKGDRILSVNNHRIHDELEFVFFSQEPLLTVLAARDKKKMTFIVDKEEYEDTGIVLEPLKVMTCRNNCIFCFVSQLPKGLRRSLYVKDEDYRMSFLYGNYVTLSNLTDADRARIVEQRLSPLYISVHTTNHELRQTMLGNRKAPDILDDITFFTSRKIKFHAQIVLCPGFNDGVELERTIRDLSRFYPYMLSIAVVPVGLTKFRKKQIAPVGREDAAKAIGTIDKFQKRFLKKYGDPLVYAADELYIKAEIPFPSLKNYGDLPQIENGVGMVPSFLHRSRFVKPSSYSFAKNKFLALTGTSFYPFLSQTIRKIRDKTNVDIDVIPVVNHFFGESVTVTGLLTGRDIIRALADRVEGSHIVLIPDVVLRESTNFLLDNLSIEDITTALNAEVRVIEPTLPGLLQGMEEAHAR